MKASLCMGFSRQAYWSGLPCPPPGNLPEPGIEPGLLHCRLILYCLNYQGSLFPLKPPTKIVQSISLSAGFIFEKQRIDWNTILTPFLYKELGIDTGPRTNLPQILRDDHRYLSSQRHLPYGEISLYFPSMRQCRCLVRCSLLPLKPTLPTPTSPALPQLGFRPQVLTHAHELTSTHLRSLRHSPCLSGLVIHIF